MVLKFPLFITLFLAFAAWALPPSQLGARLAHDEDLPTHPTDGSPSIIPRIWVASEDWAGIQRRSFSLDNLRLMDRASVSFVVPEVDTITTPNSNVTFAVALGVPESCILLAGVHVGVTGGNVEIYPVWGTSLDDIYRVNVGGNDTIRFHDSITISVEYSNEIEIVIRIVNRRRPDEPDPEFPSWSTMSTFFFSVKSICFDRAEAMVLAARVPHSNPRLWRPLADFGSIILFDFSVHYIGWPPIVIQTTRYSDIRRSDPSQPLGVTRFTLTVQRSGLPGRSVIVHHLEA